MTRSCHWLTVAGLLPVQSVRHAPGLYLWKSAPPPPFFWKSVITGKFKSKEFVSVHSKELTSPFFVSVHSKRVIGVDERQSTSAPRNGHEALIPGDFKSNEFVRVDSKAGARRWRVSAYSKGVIRLGGHSWRVCISKGPPCKDRAHSPCWELLVESSASKVQNRERTGYRPG